MKNITKFSALALVLASLTACSDDSASDTTQQTTHDDTNTTTIKPKSILGKSVNQAVQLQDTIAEQQQKTINAANLITNVAPQKSPQELTKDVIASLTQRLNLRPDSNIKTAAETQQAATSDPKHPLNLLSTQTLKDAYLLFVSEDSTGDKKLEKSEFTQLIKYATNASKVSSFEFINTIKANPLVTEANTQKVTDLIFSTIDQNTDQALTFDEFKQLITNTDAIKEKIKASLTGELQKKLTDKLNSFGLQSK